jgi:hypothetical protein
MTTVTTVPPETPRPAAGEVAARPPHRPAPVGPMLRALFLKEARELAPWLALAALAFSAATALAFRTVATHAVNRTADAMGGLLAGVFMLVYLLVPAGTALLAGFVQFFPESKPGRYAFLVHRPASRSLVFWGKALAGVALLWAALGVPLMVAVLWARDPAHLPAPFTWAMVQAPLADLLSAVPYYFAGVLVARRTDARWLGSRLLPAAAPLVASGLTLVATRFEYAALAAAIATGVMLEPARAAFVAAGQLRPQPRHAKALLGVGLAVALLTAGGAALGIIDSITAPPRDYVQGASYAFLHDGTAVRIRHDGTPLAAYETLDGRPVGDGSKAPSLLNFTQVMTSEFLAAYTPRRLIHQAEHYFSYAFQTPGRVEWYREADGGYLVGMDQEHRRLVGALGPGGLAAGKRTPPVRFPTPVLVAGGASAGSSALREMVTLLAAGDTVYQLNDDLTLSPRLTTPDRRPVRGLSHLFGTLNENRAEGEPVQAYVYTVVLTDAEILFLKKDQVVARCPRPETRGRAITAAYLPGQNRFAIQLRGSDFRSGNRETFFLNEGGGIDRTVALPDDEFMLTGAPSVITEVIGPAVAPPTGVAAIGALDALWEEPNRQDDARYLRNSLLVASATAVCVALLARRRLQRPAGVGLWAVLGLALGPVAVPLMLSLQPRAALAACPGCGRRRRVDEAACPACGAAFRPPAANGTEIFA